MVDSTVPLNDHFEAVIAKMPVLLDALQANPLVARSRLGIIPEKGIYVFYENDVPLYVGRSGRLRRRLLEHGQPSSWHNSATFAFILAFEEAEEQGMAVKSRTRTELQNDELFGPLYLQAKRRVSRMQIRVVEVSDPIEQTLFEVYAALKLEAPYNDFENH